MEILREAPRGAEAPSRPEPAPRPIPVVVNDLADDEVEGDGWPPFPDPIADSVWVVSTPLDA